MTEKSAQIPPAAAALGGAGAVPFAALALFSFPIWPPYHLTAALALQLYAAIILSFLGGVRWGAAMARNGEALRWPTLTPSVLPPLAAWGGVLAPNFAASLALLAAGYLGLLAYDVASARSGELPAWYAKLRTPLTVVALASLAAAAAARMAL